MKKTIFNIFISLFFLHLVSYARENVSTEYNISPNDLIEISVYEEPDLAKTVRVAEDGTISYPLLGVISVSSSTAKELEKKIAELLMRDYLVNPQVSVFIKEYAKFSILGQVRSPGSYELKSGLRVMDAIALAGGFSAKANAEDVKIVRMEEGAKQTININTNNIAGKEDKGNNIILQGGDLLIVGETMSESSTAYSVLVFGQVRSPGRYPFRKDMTAVEAIALAGGLKDTAAGNSTKVVRTSEDGKKQIFTVPVGSILNGINTKRDIVLQPDDTVIVPESFF